VSSFNISSNIAASDVTKTQLPTPVEPVPCAVKFTIGNALADFAP